MLDVFNIPGQQDNVKIFYAAGTTAWQTWQKPRNCKFIWMMCIGGGAGGSGGTGGFAGQAGGTGGGSGAIVRVLFPANVLPDTLYVQPGNGGGGGGGLTNATNLALAAGASGNRSWVVINPSGSVPVAMNTVCVSGAIAAGGGGLAGGTAETIATPTQAGLLSLGNFIATAGQVGGASQASITPLTTIITSGGAGGGSSQATIETGGSIVATSISPLIAGGAITANGNHGIISWKPLYFLGGAGGGGNSAGGITGNGGNGAYGCGGGAGGSNTGNPGGNGGNGGDGLVIIATF